MSTAQDKRIRELEKEVALLRSTITTNKESFTQTLRKYVTDEVMREILTQGTDKTIASERREVTMMFTDIRHSTELSETMDPEDYIRLINHYFEEMIVIIDSWQGNILEFVGDAIVVVFGAPKHNDEAARSALCSAVAMQRVMPRINEWNQSRGYPTIEMGIGIHTGEAIVGCIGSETRMKYDMIGRNVNLAARIVSYAGGGQIYVSDSTLEAGGNDIEERAEGQRLVHPKGIQDEICIHEVRGVGPLRLV